LRFVSSVKGWSGVSEDRRSYIAYRIPRKREYGRPSDLSLAQHCLFRAARGYDSLGVAWPDTQPPRSLAQRQYFWLIHQDRPAASRLSVLFDDRKCPPLYTPRPAQVRLRIPGSSASRSGSFAPQDSGRLSGVCRRRSSNRPASRAGQQSSAPGGGILLRTINATNGPSKQPVKRSRDWVCRNGTSPLEDAGHNSYYPERLRTASIRSRRCLCA